MDSSTGKTPNKGHGKNSEPLRLPQRLHQDIQALARSEARNQAISHAAKYKDYGKAIIQSDARSSGLTSKGSAIHGIKTPQTGDTIDKLYNDSLERAMYEEIVTPALSRHRQVNQSSDSVNVIGNTGRGILSPSNRFINDNSSHSRADSRGFAPDLAISDSFSPSRPSSSHSTVSHDKETSSSNSISRSGSKILAREEHITVAAQYSGQLRPSNIINRTIIPQSTSSMAANSSHNSHVSTESSARVSSSSTHGDTKNFHSTVVARLAQVEGEMKALKQELSKSRDKCTALELDNCELRIKCADYEHAAQDTDTETYIAVLDELKELKQENSSFRQQVQEMKDFLADYGLVWVGKENQETHRKSKQEKSSLKNIGKDSYNFSSTPPSHAPLTDNELEYNYSEFAKKIQELNEVISSEPTQILVTENRTARLVNPNEIRDRMKLIYYKNGLLINRGPIRYNNSSNYHSFMQDIFDGYFPSEFKNQYPDGVIFELIDKHDDLFDEQIFQRENRLKASKLLDRLPKTVIRNGELIQVREEISSRIVDSKASSDKATLAHAKESEQDVRDTENTSMDMARSPSSSGSGNDLVQIAVKWLDGSVVKLKFSSQDLIKDVRTKLIQYFKSENKSQSKPPSSFTLRCVYPNRQVLQNDISLLDAGLAPNGTIFANEK